MDKDNIFSQKVDSTKEGFAYKEVFDLKEGFVPKEGFAYKEVFDLKEGFDPKEGFAQSETFLNYKPSGVEWLGDVPSEWKVDKFKRLLKEPLRYGANESGEFEDRNHPRYIRITDFKNDGTLKEDIFKSLPPAVAKNYLLNNGDLLFARSGATSGKVFLFKDYNGEACFAGYLIKAVCDEKYLDFNFMFYFTQSPGYETWKNMIFTQSTIPNIGADKYALLQVCYPKIKEQAAIVTYLDQSTANIDKVIATKQKLLEKLEQYKQSKIHECVTKGLNPTAPLKDSGIEWIGDMPMHWKTRRIKDIANLQSGDNITSEEIKASGDYPVYGGNGLRGYYEKYNHDGFHALIGRQGALCGNINYGNGKFWATEHAVVVTIFDGSDMYWLGELMKEMNINQYSQGSAQPGLAVENIRKLIIPYPPRNEQKEISNYLQLLSSNIAKEKSIIEQQIEKLKLYRKCLIHECVTGKRKVSA